MKKIILGSLVVASSLLAVDVKPFIGLDLGVANTSIESIDLRLGDRFTDSSTNFAYGLKGGTIIDKNHRVYGLFSNVVGVEYDGVDVDIFTFSVNYDYLFNLDMFTPYIGAHLGFGSVELSAEDDFSIDDSSFMYGLGFGAIKEINENISFEIGYRFTQLDAEPTATEFGIDAGKVEMDPTHNFFIGFNYSF